MDIDWDESILRAPCGHARTEGVMITSMEPESRERAMTIASYKKESKMNALDDLNLTAFHGLRVKMSVHIGPDTGGIKGPTIAFTEALAEIATGGMILLSPPVAELLAGGLDQLSNSVGKSEQKNVPRLVHMGALVFNKSDLFHEAEMESYRKSTSLKKHQKTATISTASYSPKPPNLANQAPQGLMQDLDLDDENASSIELGNTNKPILMPDGRILTPNATGTPVEVFHIFNEPLFGRHLKWDDINMELPEAVVHSVGYYDAPVKRENRPEFAVVIFGDVENGKFLIYILKIIIYPLLPTLLHPPLLKFILFPLPNNNMKPYIGHELQHNSPATFTQACGEVNQIMSELLVKHRGYQVPQREGHYMHTFWSPKDAVAYHTALQAELLSDKPKWPKSYETNPLTKKVYNDDNELLYNGLTVSLGMSVGVISKSLERSRANYLGPTCNRSARVCGLAKQGQLLMCQTEYESPTLEYVREGCKGTMPKVGSKVMLENQILKGIKGTHSIVFLETDELTLKRRDFPRPKLQPRQSMQKPASPASIGQNVSINKNKGGNTPPLAPQGTI